MPAGAVKARDGVDVPPPPLSPETTRSSFGGAMAARPWLTAGTARAANGKSKSRQVQSGPVVATGPVMQTDKGNAPGHAVVDGASAPGHAVVGGASRPATRSSAARFRRRSPRRSAWRRRAPAACRRPFGRHRPAAGRWTPR